MPAPWRLISTLLGALVLALSGCGECVDCTGCGLSGELPSADNLWINSVGKTERGVEVFLQTETAGSCLSQYAWLGLEPSNRNLFFTSNEPKDFDPEPNLRPWVIDEVEVSTASTARNRFKISFQVNNEPAGHALCRHAVDGPECDLTPGPPRSDGGMDGADSGEDAGTDGGP